MHLLGETVEQLGGGIEVQPRLFARLPRQQLAARLADARHQAFAAVGEALGEALGVMVGDGAATDLLEQPGDFLQARFERFQHLGGALRAQAFEQLVEGVETGIHGHELAAQANQPAIAQAHVRILEGARRAHRLQAHGLGGETTLLLSKRSRPPTPRRLSRTNAANRPKRTYSALRIAALVVCGMITALTTPSRESPG